MFNKNSLIAIRAELALLLTAFSLVGVIGGLKPLPLLSAMTCIYLAAAGVALPAFTRQCRLQLQNRVLILHTGLIVQKHVYLPLWKCCSCMVWHTPLQRYLRVGVLVLKFYQQTVLLPFLPQDTIQRILSSINPKT